MKEQPARDIKNSCLAWFVGKELFNTILNIAAPVLSVFIGAVITYGIVYGQETAALKVEAVQLRSEITDLQNQINKKLDTLLKRGE